MDKDECTELKNIQYQTMLLSKNKLVEQTYSDITNERIDIFLQKEQEINVNESWNKLDKNTKNKKIQLYSKKYITDNNLDTLTEIVLSTFLRSCLDKKRLLNNKEVIYCKILQEITSIPALKYKNNKFGLDRCDKRISTLKSLTPIKSKSV